MSVHSDTLLALSESVGELSQGVEVKHGYERSGRLITHVKMCEPFVIFDTEMTGSHIMLKNNTARIQNRENTLFRQKYFSC